jgi:hypothetical protein
VGWIGEVDQVVEMPLQNKQNALNTNSDKKIFVQGKEWLK